MKKLSVDEKFKREYARLLVRKAIGKGQLVRPTECERCGVKSGCIHAHHSDYDKALDVEWLCSTCHVKQHHPNVDRWRPKVKFVKTLQAYSRLRGARKANGIARVIPDIPKTPGQGL